MSDEFDYKIKNHDEARSIRVGYYPRIDEVQFDLFKDGDPNCNNIPAATAREIAQRILEIVPEPVRPTLLEEQWPQVKIGDQYGFGQQKDGSFPYTKTSEAIHNGSPLTPRDHERGIHWRKPTPNNFDQVEALPVGTVFQFDKGALWMRTKDGVADLFLIANYPTSPVAKGDKIPTNWRENHHALNIIREGVNY